MHSPFICFKWEVFLFFFLLLILSSSKVNFICSSLNFYPAGNFNCFKYLCCNRYEFLVGKRTTVGWLSYKMFLLRCPSHGIRLMDINWFKLFNMHVAICQLLCCHKGCKDSQWCLWHSFRFNFYSQAMLLYLWSVIMQLSDFSVVRDTFRCASVIYPFWSRVIVN